MQPKKIFFVFWKISVAVLALWITGPLVVGATPIPDMLVQMTAETSPVHVLVVEKASQRLYLYAYDPKSGFRQAGQMACSTGKVDGGKQQAGDMKTPQGIYFVTGKHPDRDLSPRYGIGAYPLDYPHLLDRMAGRNGHSIWLHGTNRPLKARDSNGCIALANEDLARLDPFITPKRTAVLIAGQLVWVPAAEAQKAAAMLSELVHRWHSAVEAGSYHDFLALYAPGYLPPIAWWRDWIERRQEINALDGKVSLDLGQVDMYRHDGRFVVRFDLEVTDGGRHASAGSRKLFVAECTGQMRIVGDEYLHPAGETPADGPDPLVAAVGALKAARLRPDDGITGFVDRWLTAWSAKDIDGYADCYAAAFHAEGMNRRAWVRYKKRLNRKYRFIRVDRGELTIEQNGGRATVRFAQRYASDAFQTEGIKTLRLKREDGGWKIHREIWQRR